jgi:hypothetical protein
LTPARALAIKAHHLAQSGHLSQLGLTFLVGLKLLPASCRRCWREYVNRMNLESMRSIWLVYLYCCIKERQLYVRTTVLSSDLSLLLLPTEALVAEARRSTVLFSTRS